MSLPSTFAHNLSNTSGTCGSSNWGWLHKSVTATPEEHTEGKEILCKIEAIKSTLPGKTQKEKKVITKELKSLLKDYQFLLGY